MASESTGAPTPEEVMEATNVLVRASTLAQPGVQQGPEELESEQPTIEPPHPMEPVIVEEEPEEPPVAAKTTTTSKTAESSSSS
jgi:hypothetical protein